MSKSKILSSCAIFKGLETHCMNSIEAISEVVTVADGERIFEKGGAAQDLYVVSKGAIKLCLPVTILLSEKEIDIDVRRAGDLIGWSALIPPHELTMSAYAVESTELLRIPGKELRAVCEEDEHISAVVISRLASVIGRRLVQLEQMLAKEIELNAPSI